MRKFDSGATRNDDGNKLDYYGFLCPEAMKEFADYMNGHRKQADGQIRDSDNWKKGIPVEQYIRSLVRHTIDLWRLSCGFKPKNPDNGEPCDRKELLCAIIFNAQGLLHETVKGEQGNGNRVYILGPMRGIEYFNFSAFDTAERQLAILGYDPVSPARIDRDAGFDPYALPKDYNWDFLPDTLDMGAIAKRDIEACLDCDAYCCLPGWAGSVCAKIEKDVLDWMRADDLTDKLGGEA